ERTVWIVLEHEQTAVGCDARKRLPPLECNAPAGRILKIRETVQKASVLRECRRELARNRSFVVRRNGHELRLAQGEGLERSEVGRRLDEDAAARIDQHLAEQIEALLGTRRHEHVGG